MAGHRERRRVGAAGAEALIRLRSAPTPASAPRRRRGASAGTAPSRRCRLRAPARASGPRRWRSQIACAIARPRPLPATLAGGRAAVEAVQRPLAVLAREARAVVAHGQGRSGRVAHRHRDGRPRRAVLEGVVDQHPHQLAEPAGVAGDRRSAAGRSRAAARDRARASRRRPRPRRCPGAPPPPAPPAAGLGQREELGHRRRQAARLRAITAADSCTSSQLLRASTERATMRAWPWSAVTGVSQLVRGVGDEPLLLVGGALGSLEQPVERCGEPAQLVRPALVSRRSSASPGMSSTCWRMRSTGRSARRARNAPMHRPPRSGSRPDGDERPSSVERRRAVAWLESSTIRWPPSGAGHRAGSSPPGARATISRTAASVAPPAPAVSLWTTTAPEELIEPDPGARPG